MKIGDLVKIIYKHGAVNYLFGIYLGETRVQQTTWVKIVNQDGEQQNLYKFDYIFEVINECG